jgi:hypothetical protein
MRSAWWCHDGRQKIETCCEGDCPSAADLMHAGAGKAGHEAAD